MGPSREFQQGHLPFGLGRACEQLHRDYQAKHDRWKEQRREEDARAKFIDSKCSEYRTKGIRVQLVRPERGENQNLHLVANGRVMGFFVTNRGETSFVGV